MLRRMSPLRKKIYIGVGWAMVGLGTAGIFLPLLPTTPFLLLAAYLFARSSRRWHDWLLSQPTLSPYIHAFRERRGLTPTQKLRIALSITIVMWASIYLVNSTPVRWGLGGGWAFWMAVLLMSRTAAATTPPAASRETVEGRG